MHWRRKWQPTLVFLPGIPGTGEPSGLPSMGSHRVGHDWSDLAAAAAATSVFGNEFVTIRKSLLVRVENKEIAVWFAVRTSATLHSFGLTQTFPVHIEHMYIHTNIFSYLYIFTCFSKSHKLKFLLITICVLSHVFLSCLTLQDLVVCNPQAPLSMGFSRQECPFPSLGDHPDPGIKPVFLTFHALAGEFFTTSTVLITIFSYNIIHSFYVKAN